MLRVEAAFPGFAGFYVDSSNRVILLTRASGDRDENLRQSLSSMYAGLSNELIGRVSERMSQAQVHPARYSLSELIAFEKKILWRSPGSIRGITGAGVSVPQNKVLVTFESHQDSAQALQKLSDLGIPTTAIDARVIPGEQWLTSTFQDRARPTRAGIRIELIVPPGNQYYACSLGPNVTTTSNAWYFLTAAHCVVGSWAQNGRLFDWFYQNYGPNVSNRIGQVVVNPVWQTVGCPIATNGLPADFCPYADIIAGSYSNATAAKQLATSVTQGNNGNAGTQQINNWYPVVGALAQVELLSVGHEIFKSGNNTGTTRGTLASTCFTAFATMQWLAGSSQTKVVAQGCLIIVQGMGFGFGDSGGIVFTRLSSGGAYWLLGTFSGGHAINLNSSSGRCALGSACLGYVTRWDRINSVLSLALGPLSPG